MVEFAKENGESLPGQPTGNDTGYQNGKEKKVN